MKATELIERLQELIDEHGDLAVQKYNGSSEDTVWLVDAYDNEGNGPMDKYAKAPTQIFLH